MAVCLRRIVAFGTIDSWILWNLCKERPHLTDETNASRTLLFNIRKRNWDDRLLKVFGVSQAIVPSVRPSRSFFGTFRSEILGMEIPVLAVCGDQQASTYAAIRAQSASATRVTKITFGTGVFVVQTIGKTFRKSASFFTTLVTGRYGTIYAFEQKIDGSGERVTYLLKDKNKLREYLYALTKKQMRICNYFQ